MCALREGGGGGGFLASAELFSLARERDEKGGGRIGLVAVEEL